MGMGYSAKYFSEWIKRTAFGAEAKTVVCKIYTRDGDIFDRMNKVCMYRIISPDNLLIPNPRIDMDAGLSNRSQN